MNTGLRSLIWKLVEESLPPQPDHDTLAESNIINIEDHLHHGRHPAPMLNMRPLGTTDGPRSLASPLNLRPRRPRLV
jgi:hypothetical protein